MNLRMRWAPFAATTAALLAIYEAIAVITDETPTITEIIEAGPELLELALLLALLGWLTHHFGWWPRRRDDP